MYPISVHFSLLPSRLNPQSHVLQYVRSADRFKNRDRFSARRAVSGDCTGWRLAAIGQAAGVAWGVAGAGSRRAGGLDLAGDWAGRAGLEADRFVVGLADVLHLERQVVPDGETLALDQVAVGQREHRVAAVRQVVGPRQVPEDVDVRVLQGRTAAGAVLQSIRGGVRR